MSTTRTGNVPDVQVHPMGTQLPRDDGVATLTRIEGARGRRYGEVVLIGTDATGRRIGSVDNTTAAFGPTISGTSTTAPVVGSVTTGPEPGGPVLIAAAQSSPFTGPREMGIVVASPSR